MRVTTYRGHDIVEDQGVIFVETLDGPIDAPTIKRAKQYVDAMIEEAASIRARIENTN